MKHVLFTFLSLAIISWAKPASAGETDCVDPTGDLQLISRDIEGGTSYQVVYQGKVIKLEILMLPSGFAPGGAHSDSNPDLLVDEGPHTESNKAVSSSASASPAASGQSTASSYSMGVVLRFKTQAATLPGRGKMVDEFAMTCVRVSSSGL